MTAIFHFFFAYKRFYLLSIIFLFSTVAFLHAQPLQKAENLLANKNNSQWSFEENRGQLADENGKVLNDIKYYGKDKGVSVYLRSNKISFVFSKIETVNKKPDSFSEATGNIPSAFSPTFKDGFSEPEEVKISTSRIDLELLNANPQAQILAEEKISYYTNYYLAHTPEEGITHVPHFKKLIYKNIYSNIDLVLYVKAQGMKYEFVVHPKGNVSDIKLSWNGTKPDVLANGGIKYASALGEMTESKPFSFISGENGREVKSAFKIQGNKVGFKVGKYDESKVLVIDPMLVWGTYYGGEREEQSRAIVTDNNKYIYITGLARSFTGIATNGTHQQSLGGNTINAYIVKFDTDGIRQWGTYFGGNNGAIGWSISVDSNNNPCIAGSTKSTTGIATPGAHQTSFLGAYNNSETFIAKFNSYGLRQWATYYGGNDEVLKIAHDKKGNIYLTGTTAIDSFISTIGAHQISLGGGNDAFIVKFNSNGERQWGTYYGGTANDYGSGITTDIDGYIYITGYTASFSEIATGGTHKVTNSRGSIDAPYDVFIAKFNSNGERQWGTYFGGYGSDHSTNIRADGNGDVYIIGTTMSATGIATADAYQTTRGGNFSIDGFIAKFNSVGIRVWSSYFGGSDIDICTDITIDGIGNTYITGFTRSLSKISEAGVFQEKHGGGIHDAFIAKFNTKGKKLWGTYYGGSGYDGGYGIVYLNKMVFLTGTTDSHNGISTKDSHQPSKVGLGVTNAFLSKFGELPADAGISTFGLPSENTCAGKYEINVRIKNYSSLMQLENAKIGWSINGINQKDHSWQGILEPGNTTVTVKIGNANFLSGNNIIKIWTYEPNGNDDINNSNDTLTQTIYFLPTPEAKTGNDTSICIGESVTIGAAAKSGNTYSWASNPPGITSSQSKFSVTPTITATYFLKETDTTSGCVRADSVTVTVHEFPDPVISGDTDICGKNTAVFQVQNKPGSTYKWETEGGNIISGQSTNSITIKIDKATKTGKVKLTETNAGGCATNKELTYHYTYSPLTELDTKKLFICEGINKLVKIDSAGNNDNVIYYRWYPDEADPENFIILKKVNNNFIVVRDICNKEFQEEIKINSKCPLSLVIFPNPAQRDVTIKYSLSENVNLKISLYDRLGKEVLIIADGNYEPGMYEYKIDALSDNLSSAMYAVRMIAGEEIIVKQFIVVK